MNREKINEGIRGLKYNPDEILAFEGTKINNVEPTREEFDGSTYIVKTQHKRNISGEFDIAVPTSNRDITFPGALILANRKLVNNLPDPISTKRADVELTIDLPGMKGNSKRVTAEYDDVLQAKEDLVKQWIMECGGQSKIPANMQLTSCVAKDNKQLALKLGCDIEYLKNKLDLDLSNSNKSDKTVYILQFKQIFYMLSAELPQEPADVFADTVTWEMLRNKGIDDNNPPAFVRNVSYGREIYIKIESDLSEDELTVAINGMFSSEGVIGHLDNLSVEDKKKLAKTTYAAIAIGGNPKTLKGLLMNMDIKKMNELILEEVDLSENNPAAPLSFTTAFLKDGKTAKIMGHTEYIEEETQAYKGGNLKLVHTGAYVAKFDIAWDEICYENGQKTIKHKEWHSGNKTARYETTIPLKGNVRNIDIKAQGKTGLVWEPWRTSINVKGLPLLPNRTVEIWGTTLNQKSKITPTE